MNEGRIIGGRYRLERLLGEGGMGQVWAASHLVTKARVALKVLHPQMAANLDVRKRFLREARAAAAVRHPNVVAIHDVFEDEGASVIIMDFLEGESLGSLLVRENRLSVSKTAELLLPVCAAMKAAHDKGIVHRDLKPDNIFLERRDDGSSVVRVLDFGIAKLTSTEGDAAQTAGITRTGSLLGTPYYMSPEQACGDRDLDARSDIWALGIILYECLAGKRPTEAATLGLVLKAVMTGAITPIDQTLSGLPSPLVTCIGRMLSVDKANRPSSVDDVSEVLASCRSFRGKVEPRTSPTSAGSREVSLLLAGLSPFAATEAAPSMHGSASTIEPRVPKRGLLLPLAGVGAALAIAVGALVVGLSRSEPRAVSPPPPPATELRTASDAVRPAAAAPPPSTPTTSTAPASSASAIAEKSAPTSHGAQAKSPRPPPRTTAEPTPLTRPAVSSTMPPKPGKLIENAPF